MALEQHVLTPTRSEYGPRPWHGKRRRSTLLAVALVAGGLVPACIPDWPWGLALWCAGSWLLLAGCIAWHAGGVVWFAVLARFRKAALEALQAIALALAALLLLPLLALNDRVAFVDRCLALRAQALAVPDDGGPRFAWREGGDADQSQWAWRTEGTPWSGLAYDASGQILRPAWLRSPRWHERVAGTVLARDCWRAERILGPFYRWDASGCVVGVPQA